MTNRAYEPVLVTVDALRLLHVATEVQSLLNDPGVLVASAAVPGWTPDRWDALGNSLRVLVVAIQSVNAARRSSQPHVGRALDQAMD